MIISLPGSPKVRKVVKALWSRGVATVRKRHWESVDGVSMEVATIHGHSGLVCLTSGGAPVSPSRTVPVYMSWIMHTEMEWAGYLLETRASERASRRARRRGGRRRKKRGETKEVKGGYERRGPEKRIKREGSSISELAKKKDRFAGPRERRWPDVCNAINRQDLTTFVSPKRAERRIRRRDLCTRANESEQGMWIIARWEERQRKEKKKKRKKVIYMNRRRTRRKRRRRRISEVFKRMLDVVPKIFAFCFVPSGPFLLTEKWA